MPKKTAGENSKKAAGNAKVSDAPRTYFDIPAVSLARRFSSTALQYAGGRGRLFICILIISNV
jgi:hypothetical protein